MQIYIHTLYTHTNTYNGMDYWCTSVMGTQYIDTLHYRTLRTHIFLSKNASTSNHNQRSINCSLKKYTFTFIPITNWVIAPTYWVINFRFRGFFSIACGAAFMKYWPFVILMNLPTDIQPNFIFLTIDTYMISYRPPNIYTQSSHLPSVCPSMSYLWMDIIYQPLDRYSGPDLV